MLMPGSLPAHPSLRFTAQPSITLLEGHGSGGARTTRSQLNMAKQTYETFNGDQITKAMVVDAARLFSYHYGVWGRDCPGFATLGARVKLNTRRLHLQCLPEGANTAYTRVIVNGTLAGHALFCRWKHPGDGRNVCWVTQLVVHKECRGRGLAGMLLRALREVDDDIIGIMSSHPLALIAAARSVGSECSLCPPLGPLCYLLLMRITCLIQ
jgi:hypothetical protein